MRVGPTTTAAVSGQQSAPVSATLFDEVRKLASTVDALQRGVNTARQEKETAGKARKELEQKMKKLGGVEETTPGSKAETEAQVKKASKQFEVAAHTEKLFQQAIE